ESATYCPSVAKRVSPTLLIPTGGTSGQIKFTRHTWSTLLASVVGFCQTFQAHFSGEGSSLINSYCVLPLYHVSGLMQTLRSALSGGQIVLSSFKALESSPPLVSQPSDWFISLVPTQLSRLLNAGQADWLSQFRAVLLGGAPAWSTLLAEAQTQSIPLCLSYGMTETAAMVTVLSPQDFLQGRRGAGKAMPHATVQIEQAGQQVDVGEVGQVVIRSEAIAQNYYNTPSEQFSDQTFYTDDLGYLDADGYFHITGRASEKIISGGENIFPAEVEAALRKTNQVLDVCVLGLPHPDWGEVVVAVYVPVNETVSPATLKAALTHLSRYKHPKRWFSVSALPRNAQGKLNRSMVLEQLASLSSESAQA
ncbi:MAG: AMP-binding protein, partial [Cyanobacteria bacterium J06632_3]